VTSFLSRLVWWVLRRPTGPPKAAKATTAPSTESSPTRPRRTDSSRVSRAGQVGRSANPAARESRQPRAVPVEEEPSQTPAASVDLRIGVDFGTSTTQVAVRVGQGEPFLIPLEPGVEHMPSYVARGPDGELAFGSEARNLPDNVHSLKPQLVEDPPIAGLGNLRASDGAKAMLEEVVARTLRFLVAQRLLDTSVKRLEVATRLGTTPRFDLVTRTRLRDIAQEAGLRVKLADLIEEPVAAAFELVYGGTASDGRMMVVDIGGGTLDVAVLRSDLASSTFELFATRGAATAGDRFTEVVQKRILEAVQQRRTSTAPLDRQGATALWSRAEEAKLQLSAGSDALMPLGGIGRLQSGEVQVTPAWYEVATRPLRRQLLYEIKEAYRQARLILDRGGEADPSPGTMLVKVARNGAVTRLTDSTFDLAADAHQHLDAVIPVGGGSLAPSIRATLEEFFGQDLVRDPFVDPVGAVALGLARGTALNTVNLRYPNWGILAIFDGGDEHPLYEPFASTLSLRGGETSVYSYDHEIPVGSRAIRLMFRPIGSAEGAPWPTLELPVGATHIRLGLDLFGRVNLVAIGPGSDDQTHLLAGRDDLRAPWMPREGAEVGPWVPKPKDTKWWEDLPKWNWLDNP
jgi:hypothetical protein